MPSRQTHTGIALMIPLSVCLIFGSRIIHSSTFIISSILLVMGSLAPDCFEPASYWTHRGFFHSQKLLKILFIAVAIIGFLEIIFYSIFKLQFFVFIGSFLVGYILHLLLDSTTKMSLPKESKPIGFIQNRSQFSFLDKIKGIKEGIEDKAEKGKRQDLNTERSEMPEKGKDPY